MSENKGAVTSTGEPVQKSKLPVVMIILEIVGIVLIIPYMLYNIPAIREFYEQSLGLGEENLFILRIVVLVIIIAILIFAALIESNLKKNKMLSNSVKKVSTTLIIILTVLVLANLIFSFMFK